MINYATIHDIAALVKLENACFDGDRISRRNFRYLLTKAQCRIWVYRYQHDIIATSILLMRKHSINARLYSFAVHPAHRNKGIASTLLTQMEQDAIKENYQSITLEVRADNHNAICFYQKHGYATFGYYNDYYEDHMNAIRMRKHLTTAKIKDSNDN